MKASWPAASERPAPRRRCSCRPLPTRSLYARAEISGARPTYLLARPAADASPAHSVGNALRGVPRIPDLPPNARAERHGGRSLQNPPGPVQKRGAHRLSRGPFGRGGVKLHRTRCHFHTNPKRERGFAAFFTFLAGASGWCSRLRTGFGEALRGGDIGDHKIRGVRPAFLFTECRAERARGNRGAPRLSSFRDDLRRGLPKPPHGSDGLGRPPHGRGNPLRASFCTPF